MSRLSKSVVARLGWVLLLGGLATVMTRDGHACGNVTRLRTEQRAQLLVDAEDRLRRGMPVLAAWWAAQAHGPIDATGDDRLRARARRLLAIATTRADGDVALWSVGLLNYTPALREKNLRWALHTLTELAAEAPDDAILQTYLGEALAKVPEHHAVAHQKLSALAAADRLVSPEGYAALAGLHAEAAAAPSAWFLSSRAGVYHALAEDAWRRCDAMSAATCRPPAARGGGGAT